MSSKIRLEAMLVVVLASAQDHQELNSRKKCMERQNWTVFSMKIRENIMLML